MELLFLAELLFADRWTRRGFLPLSSTPLYKMAPASPVCSPPIAFFSATIAFLREWMEEPGPISWDLRGETAPVGLAGRGVKKGSRTVSAQFQGRSSDHRMETGSLPRQALDLRGPLPPDNVALAPERVAGNEGVRPCFPQEGRARRLDVFRQQHVVR